MKELSLKTKCYYDLLHAYLADIVVVTEISDVARTGRTDFLVETPSWSLRFHGAWVAATHKTTGRLVDFDFVKHKNIQIFNFYKFNSFCESVKIPDIFSNDYGVRQEEYSACLAELIEKNRIWVHKWPIHGYFLTGRMPVIQKQK